MGGKIPRSMICGGSYAPYKLILGTQGNEIVEYEINTTEGSNENNTLSVVEGKVLMNAHQNVRPFFFLGSMYNVDNFLIQHFLTEKYFLFL